MLWIVKEANVGVFLLPWHIPGNAKKARVEFGEMTPMNWLKNFADGGWLDLPTCGQERWAGDPHPHGTSLGRAKEHQAICNQASERQSWPEGWAQEGKRWVWVAWRREPAGCAPWRNACRAPGLGPSALLLHPKGNCFQEGTENYIFFIKSE